tara:strand:- start:3315 stop:3701 length:387 start_codon:yes stop_codon:yes gene_type:complete
MGKVTIIKRGDSREGMTFPVIDYHEVKDVYTIEDMGRCYDYHFTELMAEPDPDEVDLIGNPPHYGEGDIECIDYMQDNMEPTMFWGYLEGNVKKYLHRYRHKNGLEDLKKAQWYLTYLITEMEEDYDD